MPQTQSIKIWENICCEIRQRAGSNYLQLLFQIHSLILYLEEA